MKLLKRAERVYDKIVDVMLLAAALLIILDALAVSQDVIVRKFFDFTWAPLYEIITYTLVWITFLGTTAILRAHGHVKMDSVLGRFPVRTQALINFITSCAVMVLLFGIVFYTVRLTVSDYHRHFILATILNPPKWPIEIVIPLGFVMLFIQVVRNAAAYLRTWRTGEQPDEAATERSEF